MAPRILYRREMTANRLASRIRQVLSSRVMAQRSSMLGEQISKEDGPARAVELIEAFAQEQVN